MTGLDNLMYMSSQSSGTGQATVTLSFTAGTDPDEAVQQVQNQLQSAMRKLPQAVQNQGVTVRKTGGYQYPDDRLRLYRRQYG
ncbi:aminoglycoside efflux pump [Klebsiella michiganensis]|uniref:Aminoglycoside efflux pump n=1 Tax=Klebsiella michiganensis TaxID=1134687 RepID=A0A7H4PNM3_9ENTR|nr:aminoglycoside efflux pump [Klebsiella michiganensis]